MQNTPLGPHNLQTTHFFENYSNYPRKKAKIIQTTLHKVIIIQTTPEIVLAKRPGQLSIWQLITPQSNVYKKVAYRCVDSPPILQFSI